MVIFVVAMSALAGPVFAHHGVAAYEIGKTVTVAGMVTDFTFENPHALVTIEVRDEKGNVEKWEGELTSPNNLIRSGWSRMTLKPGDRVTMTGNPAKRGSFRMWIRKITLADGKDLAIPMGGDI